MSNLAQIVTDFLGSTCRVLPVPDALVSLHRQDVTFGATKTATSWAKYDTFDGPDCKYISTRA